MEDLHLGQALHQYVRADEPPMQLSSAQLLATGRRRRALRTSLGISSGATATALVVAIAVAQWPTAGGPFAGQPTPSSSAPGSCTAYPSATPRPTPTPTPTTGTDVPLTMDQLIALLTVPELAVYG